jgi:hypothetical protein
MYVDMRGAYMEEIGLEQANITGSDLRCAIGVELEWWKGQGYIVDGVQLS